MNILEMFENNLRLLRKDSELTITSHMRTARLAVEAMGEDAKSWDVTSFYKFVNALDGLNVANTTYNKMRMSFLCLIDFVIGSRVNKELDIEFIRKNFNDNRQIIFLNAFWENIMRCYQGNTVVLIINILIYYDKS